MASAAGRAGARWRVRAGGRCEGGCLGGAAMPRAAADTGQVRCANQFRETGPSGYRSCARNPVVNDMEGMAAVVPNRLRVVGARLRCRPVRRDRGRGRLRREEPGQRAGPGPSRTGERCDEVRAASGWAPVRIGERAFESRRRSANLRRSITVAANLRAMRWISGLSSARQRRAGRDHQNESVRRRIASVVPPAAHRRCVLIEPFWGVSS